MALLSRRISHTTRPRDLRLYLASDANASIKSQVSTFSFSNRSKDTNPSDGITIFSNGWDKQCRMSGREFTKALNSLVAFHNLWTLRYTYNVCSHRWSDYQRNQVKRQYFECGQSSARVVDDIYTVIGRRNFGLQNNYIIKLQPSRIVPALIYVKTVLLLKTNYKYLIASFSNF